jgi:capsular polysaccharide biosynthesis protein
MNWRKSWLIGLYPAAWRKRYRAEFEALLEDVGPGWRDGWDVARGGLQMRLKWNFATVTAACALLGAAAAGGWSLRTQDQYVSTAVLRVEPMAGSAWTIELQKAQTEILGRVSIVEIIQAEDLYREERTRLPVEDVVQEMRNRYIRIVPIRQLGNGSTAPAFAISFAYPDRQKAQRVTQRIVAAFIERLPQAGSSVEVLDPPTLPEQPASPNRLAYAVAGFVSGLGVALLFFGVRRWPVVAAAGAAAGVVACAGSYLIPDQFVSGAVLRIEPGSTDLVRAVLTDEKLIEIMRKPSLNLYSKERARMPIGEVLEKMRKDLALSPTMDDKGLGVVVTYRHANRYKAQAVVREFVTTIFETNFIETRKHKLDPESPAPHFQHLEVVSPAVLPERPVGPNRLAFLVAGLGGGLVLGGVLTALRRRPMAMVAGPA